MVDTDVANPKLNISNIKSPLSGGGTELGKVGQGGTSKIGTLAKIVRKNRISINSIEKSQEVQNEKITRIKNIIKTKQQNVGKKLPGSTDDNIQKSLTETNQILVKIQEELMRSSSLRSKEQRGQSDRSKRGQSKAKLTKEESQLEKSSKRIKKSVGEKADQAIQPVKGIFGRIMDFIGTLVLGIAANAIFEWLKDPENMEKVKGWFSWIKDNWGWAAAAIGAIAILPLVGAIAGIIGPLAMMLPLFGAAVPFLAKALLIAGAAVLAWKGLEAGFNAIRNQVNGGSEFSAAHDVLDKQLKDAGLDNDGKKRSKGAAWDFLGWAGTRKEQNMSDEQQKISADVLAKRKQLNDMRNNMREDIRSKHSDMDKGSGLGAMSSQGDVSKHNKSKSEAEKEIRADYSERITGLVPMEINPVEARAMGGPVGPGVTYLVGEEGPELVKFGEKGTVINHTETNKVFQTISSRKKGRGGINMVNLAPITNQLPPPELPAMSGQATEVPNISSVNMSDPYRNSVTGNILGITV